MPWIFQAVIAVILVGCFVLGAWTGYSADRSRKRVKSLLTRYESSRLPPVIIKHKDDG